jgi:hypothetical protein
VADSSTHSAAAAADDDAVNEGAVTVDEAGNDRSAANVAAVVGAAETARATDDLWVSASALVSASPAPETTQRRSKAAWWARATSHTSLSSWANTATRPVQRDPQGLASADATAVAAETALFPVPTAPSDVAFVGSRSRS